jgi:hypothetical protein
VALTSLPVRTLALGLGLALALVLLPLEPVFAHDVAPKTRSETIHAVENLLDGPRDGSAGSAAPDAGDAATAGPRRTGAMEAPIPFVGLGVRGVGQAPDLSLRTLGLDGAWSDWTEIEVLDHHDGPDPETSEARRSATTRGEVDWTTGAIWAGESSHVQLIVDGDPRDLEVTFTDTAGLSETALERVGRWARSLSTTPPVEAAERAAPALQRRKDWGADESWRSGSPTYRDVKFAVLHHTASTNDYSCADAAQQVRNIYHWHTHGNGWADIGYNFLVDRCGVIYEGRYGGIGKGVRGAHAYGWNAGSFGVAMIGNHNDVSPSGAALEAAAELMAWKYAVHGLDPRPDARVSHNDARIRTMEGHRNLRGSYTEWSDDPSFQYDCPGQLLYWQTPTLRDKVAEHFGYLGISDATPVRGDWNADGRSAAGWFRNGRWYLRNENSTGPSEESFRYGRGTDIPVVGDWNGDGRDTVGIVRDGTWHLRNSLSGGAGQISFTYGRLTQGDVPLVGDWNGDGRDTVGIVRDGTWHLRYELAGGRADESFVYGRVAQGDRPLVGDWNSDGMDTIGIVRDGTWHLRAKRAGGPSDHQFVYGRVLAGDVPFVGDWNGNETDTPAIVRKDYWHLRLRNAGGPADISLRVAGIDP